MDYFKMLDDVRKIFPNAQAAQDNNGQLIIYTDMKVITIMPANKDFVVPFNPCEKV